MSIHLNGSGYDCGTEELADEEDREVGLVSFAECDQPDMSLLVFTSERDRLRLLLGGLPMGCSDGGEHTIAYAYGPAWMAGFEPDLSEVTASEVVRTLEGEMHVVECAVLGEALQDVYAGLPGSDFLEVLEAMEEFLNQAPLEELKALLGEWTIAHNGTYALQGHDSMLLA